jgi:DNA-binding transcriptional ArsR family regulator
VSDAPTVGVGESIGPAPWVRGLARLCRALADENRVHILSLLADHGEMSVTALGDRLRQSQPAVSHHLTQLRAAGLIDYRRDGKYNYYRLDPVGLEKVFDHLFPPGHPARVSVGGIDLSAAKRPAVSEPAA